MMGRIRKKLYLSAKITESMRNQYSPKVQGKKRKRGSETADTEGPQLDSHSLKSLIRRGTQTLARPQVDVREMLSWDWETTLEKCKDQPLDNTTSEEENDETEERSWLNTMEKVECAVFEGKKHQKELEQEAKAQGELDRTARREGKNTTVMIDGFAISKESMSCGDWEAVPTFAGKDPRLAEPVRAKKTPVINQEFCQHCWDGGELICCSGCPRAYHNKCLDKTFQLKAKGWTNFNCPQHECRDCQSKTADAGGLIYRCRWCQWGYCEDCLDWDRLKLVGETLPEYEMLGHEGKNNAWYIECPDCVNNWETDEADRIAVKRERVKIADDYETFLAAMDDSTAKTTPKTISEVGTPVAEDPIKYEEDLQPTKKKARMRL